MFILSGTLDGFFAADRCILVKSEILGSGEIIFIKPNYVS